MHDTIRTPWSNPAGNPYPRNPRTTRTRTPPKPVPLLTGTGFGGYGYGLRLFYQGVTLITLYTSFWWTSPKNSPTRILRHLDNLETSNLQVLSDRSGPISEFQQVTWMASAKIGAA
jgi:hypothetical protein